MRILYHYPLCPFSRKIRFLLNEKKLDFSLEEELFWKKKLSFFALNPLGQVPVFVDLTGHVFSDSSVICEYIEEAYPENPLIMGGLAEKAEIRRICAWFDGKFAQEVSVLLLHEKHIKRYCKDESASFGPNSNAIREAKSLVNDHLNYLSWLIDRRNWVAGSFFSLADIAAAAHISVVDYLGDIVWEKHPVAKEWYMKIKSRPTFRNFLSDRVAGIPAASHYSEFDF